MRRAKTIVVLLFVTSALIVSAGTTRGESPDDSRQPGSSYQITFDDHAIVDPHEELGDDDAVWHEGAGHDEGHGGHNAHGGHDAHGGHGGHDAHGEHGGHGHDSHGGWLLKTPCFLERHGVHIHGYVNGGVSGVMNNPEDRYNGVVAFNDRHGEFQMNQLWLTMEREAHTGGCGFDIGWRVDYIYGTDARFMQSTDGFEKNWQQHHRFYQSAVPQAYVDVAVNRWTFRCGKWFTFLEYEEDEATHNFFYSHSYTKEYGEPYLHTGMLAMYQVNCQLELKAGFHRGWNQFDDNNDGRNNLSVIAGFNWHNCCEDVEIRGGFTAGEQGRDNTTFMYDLVVLLKLTDCLHYVIQHDMGSSSGGHDHNFAPGEWYGIVNYLTCQLNPCWSVGTRFEWFRDDDGVRVTGHGVGNNSHGHYEGNFYELTVGLNYCPCENIRVRPELRWDWFDGTKTSGHGPFDGLGDSNHQFMVAIDAILLL